MTQWHDRRLSREEIHGLTVCQKEKDSPKRLHAETAGRRGLHPTLAVVLPGHLDRAFQGGP